MLKCSDLLNQYFSNFPEIDFVIDSIQIIEKQLHRYYQPENIPTPMETSGMGFFDDGTEDNGNENKGSEETSKKEDIIDNTANHEKPKSLCLNASGSGANFASIWLSALLIISLGVTNLIDTSKKAIGPNPLPVKVYFDSSGANKAGISDVQNELVGVIEIDQSKYMNNRTESDHRKIKHLSRATQGFKSFWTAVRPLDLFKVWRLFKKKQD